MAVRKWSDEDRAFARAIHESPLDDMPRLIYADWLEEQGDPLGAFIRLNCLWMSSCIYKDPDDGEGPEYPQYLERYPGQELRYRMHELLKEISESWDRPRPSWIETGGYDRGMRIGRISWPTPSITGRRFQSACDTLCPLLVLEIKLVNCEPDQFSILSNSPLWMRVTELDFEFNDSVWQPSIVATLASLPRVRNIRRISFKGLSQEARLFVEREIKPISNNVYCRDAWEEPT